MRRVLHVMGSLERSGMETMLINSYDEWRDQGYECDVVATSSTIGPIAPEMRECGYGVFHVPFRSSWRFLPRASFIGDFFHLCKSGYDVVHIHAESGRPVFAMLAKLAGVPRIAVTPHGIFKFHGALHLRKLIERHLTRILGGRFGMISEAVKTCEWNQFRIDGARIRNWINTSHLRPPTIEERINARQVLGIRAEQFVIVSVGNCSPTKNHTSLLRAIALLPETTQPFYLHVGREEQDAAEQKLASGMGIGNRVCFLGSQPDPRPFLWAADVFAMPSLSEGLGISALEALACGVPLVCSRVEGLSEIAAGTESSVFTATTPDSIAAGLETIAAMEPAYRNRMALRDSLLVRERFSVHNGVHSIINGIYVNEDESQQTREQIAAQPEEQHI